MNETTETDAGSARKDVVLLLEDFLSSGKCDTAFRALVDSYGGLVYSSALRRTNNNPQLAEEVAQNVFAIIARKAPSLRRHPALMAWIFKTTRFEASKAMRAERRRQKKHDALAREPISANSEDAAWREAVPLLDESLDDLSDKERQIVLQRFFEERKFKEIAQSSGRSEAACKMQLKRALDKLSKLLKKRGVALSAAAIGSGLSAELTHAAPAKVLAAIAPKALASSGQIGAASTLSISIQTMSTIKTSAITGAAVIAVASAPFLRQQSESKRLKDGLADIQMQRSSLAGRVGDLRSGGNGNAASLAFNTSASGTVQELLRARDEPIDVDALLRSMLDVIMTQDVIGMMRVLLPISNLAPDEYEELVEAINAHEGHGQAKGMALQMLGSFAPSDDPQRSIERVMRLGIEPSAYSDLLSNWGSQDPDAALAWYREREAEGAFLSKGASDHYNGYLLSELIGGIGKKDPQKALELFKENRGADKYNRMSSKLARNFGRLIRKGADDVPLRALVTAVADPKGGNDNVLVVFAASRTAVLERDADARMAFSMRYLEDPRDRMGVALEIATDDRDRPLAERADWLLENTSEDLRLEASRSIVDRSSWMELEATSAWLAEQDGVMRDSGLSSIAARHTMRREFPVALEQVEKIVDQSIRAEAFDKLASEWMLRNSAQAIESLPPDIVEKYRPDSDAAATN